MTKNELLIGLKAEESKAIEECYRIAYPSILKFITKNKGTTDDSRDFFQEGLIVLIRMVKKQDFKLTAKVSTLLFSIIRNLWFKELRKRKKQEVYVLDDNDFHFELGDEDQNLVNFELEAYQKNEIMEETMRAMDQLPAPCKRIILMYYIEELSHKEIGQNLDCSDNTARQKLFRCMGKLRTFLNKL